MNAAQPPGYRTQSEDTSYAAEQLLLEHWRNMALDEKAALIGSASVALQELSLAGLEQRLPTAGCTEIKLRALALKYGEETVLRALGIRVPDESVRFG